MTGPLGKFLILIGVILVAVGGLFLLANKLPFIGKLPGDIFIRKDHFSFYCPVTTCILISIILSVILWLFSRR
ncbi:MAG: DUF2905 domain-containing protein [bacterium]|nr:DUF2905 domain-containing protein [bacterium]